MKSDFFIIIIIIIIISSSSSSSSIFIFNGMKVKTGNTFYMTMFILNRVYK